MADDFESFTTILRTAYLAALKKALPPSAKAAALWKDPSKLVWIGLGHEQSSFYLSTSFGMLKEADAFTRANLGTKELDYLEQDKLRDPKLRAAFDDLLNPGLEVDAEDVDEDELDEAKEELRTLAVLVALGQLALELESNPSLLPMPAAKPLRITVASDAETPTWQAKLSAPANDDPAVRKLAIDALCSTKESKKLFERLIKSAAKRPELLATLRKG